MRRPDRLGVLVALARYRALSPSLEPFNTTVVESLLGFAGRLLLLCDFGRPTQSENCHRPSIADVRTDDINQDAIAHQYKAELHRFLQIFAKAASQIVVLGR